LFFLKSDAASDKRKANRSRRIQSINQFITFVRSLEERLCLYGRVREIGPYLFSDNLQNTAFIPDDIRHGTMIGINPPIVVIAVCFI